MQAAKEPPRVRIVEVPKAFPRVRPAGCLRQSHVEQWLSVGGQLRALLSRPGFLAEAWSQFLEQAESVWLDVYQITDHRQKHRGRGKEYSSKWVRNLPVAGARWPRVSAEPTWLFHVSNELEVASRMEYPISRLRALQ
eukprot:8635535-Pyramimonas_sp.AAC.1